MKQLAIMRGVSIGMRDISHPCMWFSTYISEHEAALQVLSWEAAADVIKQYGTYDLKLLEGKPCWVDVEGNLIKFLSPCVIK